MSQLIAHQNCYVILAINMPLDLKSVYIFLCPIFFIFNWCALDGLFVVTFHNLGLNLNLKE